MKAWRLAARFVILALFLLPAFPVHAEGPQRVWVDDDYCPSCADDGHQWGEDAFASISAAVDAVSPGGTVYVAPGHYREDVRITRPCQVVARGSGDAILSPSVASVTLIVAANDVTIRGLHFANTRQAAIQVLGPAYQHEPIRAVAIRQNAIVGGSFGVAVNIDSEWDYGLLRAAGVDISDNTVSGCTRAIYVYNTEAEIAGNEISGLAPGGIGIYSSQGSVSSIRANYIEVDAPDARAIYILDNDGTNVDGNQLVGTTELLTPTTALALYGYSDLVVSNNTVRGFYWGANAYTGGSARIERNTFENAVAWALNLGTAITTTRLTLADNAVRGSYLGLRLDDDGGYGLEADVRGNTFGDNIVGIEIGPSVREGQVAIHGNAICGNLVAGLRNDSDTTADASGNWWGANDGPGPSGSGDRVEGSGRASFYPWMQLHAQARGASDGRVTVVAGLGSSLYHLQGYPLTFTARRGTFVESGRASLTALTDWTGNAQATLEPLYGQAASVTVSSGCGEGVLVPIP